MEVKFRIEPIICIDLAVQLVDGKLSESGPETAAISFRMPEKGSPSI